MEKQETQNTDTPQRTTDSGSTLRQILSAHQGKRHLIVLQDFPDPDAISSAYAHQLISAEFEIEADIIHAGRVSHEQNIALVRLLEIELIKYEGELPGQYDAAVFVDNQGTTCETILSALEAAGVLPLIVVDHHEPQERLDPAFGKDPAGHYYGGGKVAAGGFEIPVGFLSGTHVDAYRDEKWQVYDTQVNDPAFR